MNRRKRYLAGAVLLVGLVGALLGSTRSASGSPAQVAAGDEVKIDNFTFTPGEIAVAKGTTVKWVNRDDIPHTVVSDDKSTFKSKPLDTDDKFSYTFTKEGTYNYFCSIHPKMTAKVIVK
jgi:plastocyanin